MPIDETTDSEKGNSNNYGLKVGSQRHSDIIAAFKDRLRLADSGWQQRSQAWAKNEDTMKAYVPTDEEETLRKQAKKDGKPQYTTIQVPYSYAMMLTLHTYLTSIFLSRTPILQVSGRHGESQQSEQCIEALLDYQLTSGNNLPPLYIWILDPLRYGLGVVGQYWDVEEMAISTRKPVPRMFLGNPIPGTEKMETIQEIIKGYEGTRLYNIRPQDFRPDPRVPVWRFQDGEFVIRFEQIGWNKAKSRERSGMYFNLDVVAKNSPNTPRYRDTGSPRTTLPDSTSIENANLRDPKGNPTRVNIHEFYWEIIPKDWGMGDGEREEKWVFTIANENTVIGCQPLGLLHNKWPFDVLEYEVGGYELFNRSVLEIAEPLNDTLTWLFNSHFFNVRKTLNDQFLVDPSMIEMRDLEDPNPGRLIRLKPAAYGMNVEQFVKQFPTVDVTRQNMGDTNLVSELMQRLIGANDNTMGAIQGSRHTATEVRAASSNSVNRIKTVGEWQSASGWSQLTQKMIAMSQQLFTDERKFRVVGDLSQWGAKYMMVTPDQIAGFYDFVPVDGTMPIDRFAQANLWQQLLAGVAQNPLIMQAYDLPKIFAFVAQLAGLKNISQFKVQALPDAQMQQMVASGQSAPMSSIVPGNPSEPKQIPGMGATG